jgi:hypothetical protein
MPSVLQLDAPRSAHWFCGSCPFGTFVHVPTVPVRLHDWQVPTQAVAQQTPCAQKPVPHSGPEPQATPTPFLTQLPPMQLNGAIQSASTVHVALQAFVPQAYGSHIDVVAAWQVPVPLHDLDEVSVEPVQLAVAQVVPAAYRRQAPEPLQVPSWPQPVAPWSVHWFSGSWPVGTLVHVPTVPLSAHDWQVPAQAVAQQKPCSQNPVMHSEGAPQAIPVGFFVQAPATQTLGAVQSASAVHEVLQTLPPHA